MNREKHQYRRIILWVLVLVFNTLTSFQISAQSHAKKYLIRQITFEGNHRTKSSRMLREVEIHVGDSLTLQQATQKLKDSKDHLINTGLFTDVTTNMFFDEENLSNIRLHFTVKEGLFFIPIPIIELADRNFNVWWTEHNRDIKFLNLGMNLKLRNISGNADELNVLGQWGYDRKFIVNYTSPYFDAEKRWNFNFRSYFSSNKELIYQTLDGDPQYMRNDDEFLRSRFEMGMSFIYRPVLNSFYKLSLGYYYNTIADEVFELNPAYFRGDNEQRYSKISVEYTFENRNNKYFGTEGWYIHGMLARNGIVKSDQLNSWEILGNV